MDLPDKNFDFNSLSREFREVEDRTAKLIAAIVRNKMEDFHCKYLSDAQMAEINPIIRNAVYTALIQMREHPIAMRAYYRMYVPPYWEDCELVDI